MSNENDTRNLAVFADFENVALGAQQANYPKFNIEKVLDRLLVKGNVVVRKAYCDWTRYQKYKRSMHEANFELIDIPHLSQSGKNSADIRMVVDALDLSYTKTHVDSFAIISGDSDFSPLVSKLRENDKLVIGIGVKNSTSDLFVSVCDEFIFYDDLIRKEKGRKTTSKKSASSDKPDPKEAGKQEAIDLVIETIETLNEERGEESRIWSSMIKQAIKRIKPGFNEKYHGFKGFNDLLQEASKQGLIELDGDAKSGGFNVSLKDD